MIKFFIGDLDHKCTTKALLMAEILVKEIQAKKKPSVSGGLLIIG
jgi:hypothetical protein